LLFPVVSGYVSAGGVEHRESSHLLRHAAASQPSNQVSVQLMLFKPSFVSVARLLHILCKLMQFLVQLI